MINLRCIICEKEFVVGNYRRTTAKCCSSQCYWRSKKGKAPWNKGLKTGLVPKSAFKKGVPPIRKFVKGHEPWNKGKQWLAMRGSNHPNWKGGRPKTNRRETMSYEMYRKYVDWQKAVFSRDNWECQFCGKHGGVLHADHIKPWASFPNLRFVLRNGRTLCPPCHRKTPTYGRRASLVVQ